MTFIASVYQFAARARAAVGAGIGWALGTFAPGCYRTAFRYGNSPQFNGVQIGVGFGLTQGLVAGLAVG